VLARSLCHFELVYFFCVSVFPGLCAIFFLFFTIPFFDRSLARGEANGEGLGTGGRRDLGVVEAELASVPRRTRVVF
jgi:hypothetical protein